MGKTEKFSKNGKCGSFGQIEQVCSPRCLKVIVIYSKGDELQLTGLILDLMHSLICWQKHPPPQMLSG